MSMGLRSIGGSARGSVVLPPRVMNDPCHERHRETFRFFGSGACLRDSVAQICASASRKSLRVAQASGSVPLVLLAGPIELIVVEPAHERTPRDAEHPRRECLVAACPLERLYDPLPLVTRALAHPRERSRRIER